MLLTSKNLQLLFFLFIVGTGNALAQHECWEYSLSSIDASSFGPLKNIFQCNVIEREAFSERRPDIQNTPFAPTTAFWAQEMVGADLARDYMSRLEGRSEVNPIHTTTVGIVDEGIALTHFPPDRVSGQALLCRRAVRTCNPDASDFLLQGMSMDDLDERGGLPPYRRCPAMEAVCPANVEVEQSHGTSVAQLVLGDAPMSSSYRSELSWINNLRNTGPDISSSFATQNPKPQIINLSLGCGPTSSCTQEYVQSYLDMAQSSITVKASGNDFPAPAEMDPTNQLDGIVVGSLAPNGLISDFSQAGEMLSISAPSDESIFSRTVGDGDERTGSKAERFSGTSGATPMVTSALTNVLSLLPGATTAELKILLQKTAIPTAGFTPNNGQNGAGALNALKLTQVAHRLRAMGWPSDEARRAINNNETYNYTDQVEGLFTKARDLMREVPYNENICKRHKQAFKLLRQAYFLAPHNQSIRQALGSIYAANGYEAQADYVNPARRSNRAKAMALRGNGPRLRALLRANQLEESDADLLYDVFNHFDDDENYFLRQEKMKSLESLFAAIPQRLTMIKNTFLRFDKNQQQTLIGQLFEAGSNMNLPAQNILLLRQLVNSTTHNNVIDSAFANAKNISAQHSRQFFIDGLNSQNPTIRESAAMWLSDVLDTQETRTLLTQRLEIETDPTVRARLERELNR